MLLFRIFESSFFVDLMLSWPPRFLTILDHTSHFYGSIYLESIVCLLEAAEICTK